MAAEGGSDIPQWFDEGIPLHHFKRPRRPTRSAKTPGCCAEGGRRRKRHPPGVRLLLTELRHVRLQVSAVVAAATHEGLNSIKSGRRRLLWKRRLHPILLLGSLRRRCREAGVPSLWRRSAGANWTSLLWLFLLLLLLLLFLLLLLLVDIGLLRVFWL